MYLLIVCSYCLLPVSVLHSNSLGITPTSCCNNALPPLGGRREQRKDPWSLLGLVCSVSMHTHFTCTLLMNESNIPSLKPDLSIDITGENLIYVTLLQSLYPSVFHLYWLAVFVLSGTHSSSFSGVCVALPRDHLSIKQRGRQWRKKIFYWSTSSNTTE